MGELDKARAAIASKGAVKTRELLADLDRDQAAELLEGLARAGFERAEKHIRVPLAQQLEALLAEHRMVPAKKLRQHLAGVESADELDHVVEQARQKGELASVYTEGAEHLTRHTGDVLSEAEVEALGIFSDALKALIATTRTRAGSRRSLWRDELAVLFEPLGIRTRHFTPQSTSVLDVIDAFHAKGKRLVFVPDVVRTLGIDTARAHSALLEETAKGVIELRPESGVNSLSDEDAALCPSEGGVLLSYVRRIP